MTDSGFGIVQVATTCDGAEAADALARSAVEAQLAACAQVDGPITSVYRWRGGIRSEQEWRVTLKTTTALAERLTDHLLAEHSYDTPEVLVTPVLGGHREYRDWVVAETRA